MKYFHSRKDKKGNMLVGRLQRYNRDERQNGCIWINIAQQGQRGFNWEERTTIKLGYNDIVQLWPRLKVKAPKIGLYHEWGENKKSIVFNRHVVEDENGKKRAAYYININGDGVFHLGWDETGVFCEFLKYALPRITDFDLQNRQTGGSNEERDENAQVSQEQVGTSDIEDDTSDEEDEIDDLDVEDDLDW